MKIRTVVLAACILAAFTRVSADQPPPSTPQPAPAPRAATPSPATVQAPTPAPSPAAKIAAAAPAPRRAGQPVNIKVDVAVTDQRGAGAPLKKTVTLVVADAMGGRIRSSAESTGGFSMPLNVDAEPEILADSKVRLLLNLQYDLPTTTGAEERSLPTSVGNLRRTQLQENLSLILESGKSMVVAQSADPIGDRQVTVEVKATILR